MDYIVRRSQVNSELPYDLLLLANENPQLVDACLPVCQAYLLVVDEQVCGVYLLRVDGQIGEIMNIAVEPAYQGRGFRKALLRHAVEVARQQGLQRLIIRGCLGKRIYGIRFSKMAINPSRTMASALTTVFS